MVHLYRELRHGILGTQLRAADPDCSGEAGFARQACRVGGAKQVGPVVNAQDNAVLRARGIEGGNSRHVGATGPLRSGAAGPAVDYKFSVGCVGGYLHIEWLSYFVTGNILA